MPISKSVFVFVTAINATGTQNIIFCLNEFEAQVDVGS